MLHKTNGTTSIQSSIVVVTPEMASAWLSANPRNRKLNRQLVAQYARAIMAGDWMLNGESIKLSQSGNLLDGQHRLAAIIKAGQSLTTLVITGLPDEVMDTVDIGKRRILADTLTMDGHKPGAQIAGTINLLHNLGGSSRNMSWLKVTTVEGHKFLDANPGVAGAVQWVMEHKGSMRWRPQYAAALFLFSKRSPEVAVAFFEQFFSGADLPGGDHPIYRLRERVIGEESSHRKATRADIMAWVIRAWNAQRNGTSLTRLFGANGGMLPEIE